jgi:hypothetical protein
VGGIVSLNEQKNNVSLHRQKIVLKRQLAIMMVEFIAPAMAVGPL